MQALPDGLALPGACKLAGALCQHGERLEQRAGLALPGPAARAPPGSRHAAYVTAQLSGAQECRELGA